MKNWILYTILGISIAFTLMLLVSNGCNRSTDEVIIKTDTIKTIEIKEIRDTVYSYNIKWKDKLVYDTLIINDTVYLKDEPKHFVDSTEHYKLDIEAVKLYGYNLDIYDTDTVWVEKEKIIIEKEIIKYNFWKNRFIPYVGVGVQYGFINQGFDVGVQIGVGIRLTK